MIDLSTTYLGLRLRTPLVASASPLSQEIDGIRHLEDAGASAVVLYSLFEEQLRQESFELEHHLAERHRQFCGGSQFFPQPDEFHMGPEGYLNHIRRAKNAVIDADYRQPQRRDPRRVGQVCQADRASRSRRHRVQYLLHSDEPGHPRFRHREDLYRHSSGSKDFSSHSRRGKAQPIFQQHGQYGEALDEAGANALVLFNRFYQPDINLDELEIQPNVLLSTPQALRLPLTWIGILHGRIRANLAATSGVHGPEDVVKLLMVGADVTMLCSTLLRNGINHLRTVELGLREWMERREYDSVQQMKGSMSQLRCSNPSAFERAQYMKAVKSIQHVMVTGREAWRILNAD